MDVVQYLVETAKAKVNAMDSDGWVALHFAAQQGHVAVVRYLLQTGKANANATNNVRQKPVDIAKSQEVADLLAAAAAMDEAAFLKAAADGDVTLVQLAVKTHKLDPNCKNVSDAAFIAPHLPCHTQLCVRVITVPPTRSTAALLFTVRLSMAEWP